MPSSTLNSDQEKRWVKIWLLAAALVVIAISSWELLLRQSGLQPEYSDNSALWMSARHKLSKPNPDTVALLGASRIQRAIDIDELGRQLNRPVVQLAVEGASGLPVLENLAADPRFRGTVVLSVAPAFSFNRRLSKLDEGNQAAWVRGYVYQSQSRRMEQELRLFIQGKFAFRSADAAVPRVVSSIIDSGTLPSADYKNTYRNRFVQIDESKFEQKASQDGIVSIYEESSEAYEEKGFAELLHYFSTVVDVLNRKGSRVFIVRLPSEGKVLAFENEHFPQERFWNEMKRNINAQFIHFEDHPQLEGFMSIDGSHIAAESATEFTSLLAAVLRENQI